MPAVPASTDAVTNIPRGDSLTYLGNASNDLMARDYRAESQTYQRLERVHYVSKD